MIGAFNPSELWQPFSVFSMGVVQGAGQVVYLKGQVALDQDGRIVGKGDMREQTRKTLDNILATRDIRRQFFSPPYPVTTTVQVVRLYDPQLMVEITATAEIPRERFKPPCGGQEFTTLE